MRGCGGLTTPPRWPRLRCQASMASSSPPTPENDLIRSIRRVASSSTPSSRWFVPRSNPGLRGIAGRHYIFLKNNNNIDQLFWLAYWGSTLFNGVGCPCWAHPTAHQCPWSSPGKCSQNADIAAVTIVAMVYCRDCLACCFVGVCRRPAPTRAVEQAAHARGTGGRGKGEFGSCWWGWWWLWRPDTTVPLLFQAREKRRGGTHPRSLLRRYSRAATEVATTAVATAPIRLTRGSHRPAVAMLLGACFYRVRFQDLSCLPPPRGHPIR